MDAKLKVKLEQALNAAIAQWKKGRISLSQYKLSLSADKKSLSAHKNPVAQTTDIERKALARKVARPVRNRLQNEGLWRKVQAAYAEDALVAEVDRRLKKFLPKQPRRPRVDPRQSVFPGFEIPTKIGSGKDALILAEVPMSRFLVFVDKFRARSERDHKRGEDLHRLAEKLRPFAGGDPSVADAFARANSQPVVLEIVKPR